MFGSVGSVSSVTHSCVLRDLEIWIDETPSSIHTSHRFTADIIRNVLKPWLIYKDLKIMNEKISKMKKFIYETGLK